MCQSSLYSGNGGYNWLICKDIYLVLYDWLIYRDIYLVLYDWLMYTDIYLVVYDWLMYTDIYLVLYDWLIYRELDLVVYDWLIYRDIDLVYHWLMYTDRVPSIVVMGLQLADILWHRLRGSVLEYFTAPMSVTRVSARRIQTDGVISNQLSDDVVHNPFVPVGVSERWTANYNIIREKMGRKDIHSYLLYINVLRKYIF